MHRFEIKQESYEETNDAQYPNNEGNFGDHPIKVEDVDVSEQFIDESGVYDRGEYAVKSENDLFEPIDLKHAFPLCDFGPNFEYSLKMNILHLSRVCEDKLELLANLRDWRLIPQDGDYMCPKCGGPFTICEDSSRVDGWRWVCTNFHAIRRQKRKKCGNTREFRTGTFFAQTKLSIFQVLAFVNLWVSNAPLKLISEQLEISKKTAIDWARSCREVLFNTFLTKPEKLGGPGKMVEIGESQFGKRRYQNAERQWVFGGFERDTGRIFMVATDHRDIDTLLPIIEQWIEEGTTIYSNCWKARVCLSGESYNRLTVNHSISFKDLDSSKRIESSWRYAKIMNLANSRKKTNIPGNLALYLFYKKCELLDANRTLEFYRLAGELYDPRRHSGEDFVHVAEEEFSEVVKEEF